MPRSLIRKLLLLIAILEAKVVAQQCPSPIWSQSAIVGPGGLFGHSMTHDTARGKTVLFGGQRQPGSCSFALSLSGETWELDSVGWSLRSSTGPSPRSQSFMVFDSGRNVVVLFGGTTPTGVVFGDTWEWDGFAWSLRATTGPAPRYLHAMTYDSLRGVCILYGGNGNGYVLGDQWEWNGSIWMQRLVVTPHPRQGHGMVFDQSRGVAVVFGGGYYGGPSSYSLDASTFEWNGTYWTLAATHGPPARQFHSMIYSNQCSKTVLFGGSNDINTNASINDVWAWDGMTWNQWHGSTPQPRYMSAAIDDSNNDRLVVLGGVQYAPGCITLLDDTWTAIFPTPPSIASVVPLRSSLTGGVPVTITGNGFLSLPSTIATIGGTPIVNQVVVNSQTITGITPPLGSPQTVSVAVTTIGGMDVVLDAIEYGHAVIVGTTMAQVGGVFDIRIASYPHRPLVLIVDTAPGPYILGSLGTAAVGFSQAFYPVLDYFGVFTGSFDPTAVTDASGQWSLSGPVGSSLSVQGVTVYAQAYVFSFLPLPANGLFYFTNQHSVSFMP